MLFTHLIHVYCVTSNPTHLFLAAPVNGCRLTFTSPQLNLGKLTIKSTCICSKSY